MNSQTARPIRDWHGNPKGIEPQSPATVLAPRAYPGMGVSRFRNPNRGCGPVADYARSPQPRWDCGPLVTVTPGSADGVTQGFEPESLWDSDKESCRSDVDGLEAEVRKMHSHLALFAWTRRFVAA